MRNNDHEKKLSDEGRAPYEEPKTGNLETKDRTGEYFTGSSLVFRCLLRLSEVRHRSLELACTRKASARASVGAYLECHFVRLNSSVCTFAVRSWVEPLGRTSTQFRVPLSP